MRTEYHWSDLPAGCFARGGMGGADLGARGHIIPEWGRSAAGDGVKYKHEHESSASHQETDEGIERRPCPHLRGQVERCLPVRVLCARGLPSRLGCGCDEIKRTSELISNVSLEYDLLVSRIFMTEAKWGQSDTPLLRNIHQDGLPA